MRRDFPKSQLPDVLAMLDQYRIPDWEREKDRVQLAILKLAGGEFRRVQSLVRIAMCDYLDVVAPAETPD